LLTGSVWRSVSTVLIQITARDAKSQQHLRVSLADDPQTVGMSSSFIKVLQASKLLTSILVAARSKAWVCSRSLAGTVGSNAAGDMDICLL
jgi:hypothetical protein